MAVFDNRKFSGDCVAGEIAAALKVDFDSSFRDRNECTKITGRRLGYSTLWYSAGCCRGCLVFGNECGGSMFRG
jgi:hypothetical protein